MDNATLGLSALGTDALAARAAHDLPTVTLVAPVGAVTAGGPNLTVSWTYAQAQSVPQGKYRVTVTNAAGSTTYWDTGFLVGTASSVTVDAVAQGIPTDTTASALRVTVFVRTTEGDEWAANTGPQPFDIQWGVVTVSVTAPSGVVSVTSPTVTWSFASTRGFAEGSYRIRLLFATSGAVLLDTGFTPGALVFLVLPYTIADGSHYQVEVTAKNTMGVLSNVSTSAFEADLSSVSSYTPNPDVGSVYEIGINGRGLMLYDNRDAEQDLNWDHTTGPLDPQRLATSATPLSESVERYLFSSASDFKGGSGQTFADRPESATDAYMDSDGVDPFVRNRLTLLNSIAREFSTAYATPRLVVAGALLLVQTGDKQLTSRATPGGSSTVFNVAAAGVISGLATDGTLFYACDGANVFRGSTAADPGAAWSTVDLINIGFGGGRVCGSYKGAGSSTPNVFTTLNDAGAEEVGGGRYTLPAGWTINSFAAGSGFVFFSAFSGDRGAIYSWDLSAAAPIEAWQMEKGEVPISIRWSQGNVVVQGRRPMGTVSRMVLYRGQVQQSFSLAGTLISELVFVTPREQDEQPPAQDYAAQGAMAAYGTKVFFGWPFMSGATATGVGTFDLGSGGVARSYKTTVGGQVYGVDIWQGRVVYTVAADGVWVQSLTGFVTTGWLRTSLADGNSNLDKVVDQVMLSAFPLGVTQSIDVSYTIDTGGSYTSVPAASLSGAGVKRKVTDLDARAQSVGLQVTLNGPGSTTPVLLDATVRYHAIGLADTILMVPVDCGDSVAALNGSALAENAAGAGSARYRWLDSLAQTRVAFQDVDWAVSGATEIYEVAQVKVKKVGVYSRSQHKEGLRLVALVTLRKRNK